MLITPAVYDALVDLGVQLVDVGDGSVDLQVDRDSPAHQARFEIQVRHRPIGAAEVSQMATRNPRNLLLLIAPSFSKTSQQAIEDRGWSWVSDLNGQPPSGRLRVPGLAPLDVGVPSDSSHVQTPAGVQGGRRKWGQFAVMRHLLLRTTWTQSELARVCGLSQPRVSQVLKNLYERGMVGRENNDKARYAWTVTDFRSLFHDWLQTYPGPGGAAPTYWFGLDGLTDQVILATRALERARPTPGRHSPRPHPQNPPDDDVDRAQPIASGDAAADLIAPTRRSQIAVVYAPWGGDLGRAGLTPAARQTATLKLIVPEDPSVWPSPEDDLSRRLAPGAPFPIADPVQVAWDIASEPRPDADQAIGAIERELLRLRNDQSWP